MDFTGYKYVRAEGGDPHQDHYVPVYFYRRKFDPADVRKNVANAIKWLAAEHKFFTEFKDDLLQLSRDLAVLRQELVRQQSMKGLKGILKKDVRELFHFFRYGAKAERRFNRYEQNLEDILGKLVAQAGAITEARKITSKRRKEAVILARDISSEGKKYMPVKLCKGCTDDIEALQKARELQGVIQQIHLEAESLLKSASLYEGEIVTSLNALNNAVKRSQFVETEPLITELLEKTGKTLAWIAALSSDLSKAKREFELFVNEGVGLPEIHRKIENLSPEKRVEYLKKMLTRKRLLMPRTVLHVFIAAIDSANKVTDPVKKIRCLSDLFRHSFATLSTMQLPFPDYTVQGNPSFIDNMRQILIFMRNALHDSALKEDSAKLKEAGDVLKRESEKLLALAKGKEEFLYYIRENISQADELYRKVSAEIMAKENGAIVLNFRKLINSLHELNEVMRRNHDYWYNQTRHTFRSRDRGDVRWSSDVTNLLQKIADFWDKHKELEPLFNSIVDEYAPILRRDYLFKNHPWWGNPFFDNDSPYLGHWVMEHQQISRFSAFYNQYIVNWHLRKRKKEKIRPSARVRI